MSDRITRTDPLIEPIYSQSNPSEAIGLGQHAIQLTCNGTTYEELASVVLRFLPRERIEILCPWEGKPPMLPEATRDGQRNCSGRKDKIRNAVHY